MATLTAMGIKITIRDGRINRNPAQATPEGWGPVLAVVERDEPLEMGDKIRFPDGDFLVVGVNEGPGASGWEQTVHIGNMWGDATDAEADGA